MTWFTDWLWFLFPFVLLIGGAAVWLSVAHIGHYVGGVMIALAVFTFGSQQGGQAARDECAAAAKRREAEIVEFDRQWNERAGKAGEAAGERIATVDLEAQRTINDLQSEVDRLNREAKSSPEPPQVVERTITADCPLPAAKRQPRQVVRPSWSADDLERLRRASPD